MKIIKTKYEYIDYYGFSLKKCFLDPRTHSRFWFREKCLFLYHLGFDGHYRIEKEYHCPFITLNEEFII